MPREMQDGQIRSHDTLTLEEAILKKGAGEDERIGLLHRFLLTFSTEADTDKIAIHLYGSLLTWANEHRSDLPLGGRLRFTLSDDEGLERLSRLQQLGILTNPKYFKGLNVTRPISDQPDIQSFKHRRLTHALLVSQNMRTAAERLGFSLEVQDMAAAAGLWHDREHSALSHVGDTLVDKAIGQDHEERCCNKLSEIANKNWPEAKQVSSEELSNPAQDLVSPIPDIIREKSLLGELLGLIDTISYLQIDMLEAGLPDLVPADIMSQFGHHIFWNRQTGSIEVDKQGENSIVDLLDKRAEAYGRIYTHPISQMYEAAQIEGMKRLISLGKLSINDLKDKTDAEIYGAILYETMLDPQLKPYFIGFNPVGPGFLPICTFSPQSLHEDETVDSVKDRLQTKLDVMPSDLLVIRPFDRYKKTVEVLDAKGDFKSLTAQHRKRISHIEGRVIICCKKSVIESNNIRISFEPPF